MPEESSQLLILNQEIVACRKCPRLVRYREKVAREKRRAYREWTYWASRSRDLETLTRNY